MENEYFNNIDEKKFNQIKKLDKKMKEIIFSLSLECLLKLFKKYSQSNSFLNKLYENGYELWEVYDEKRQILLTKNKIILNDLINIFNIKAQVTGRGGFNGLISFYYHNELIDSYIIETEYLEKTAKINIFIVDSKK